MLRGKFLVTTKSGEVVVSLLDIVGKDFDDLVSKIDPYLKRKQLQFSEIPWDIRKLDSSRFVARKKVDVYDSSSQDCYFFNLSFRKDAEDG